MEPHGDWWDWWEIEEGSAATLDGFTPCSLVSADGEWFSIYDYLTRERWLEIVDQKLKAHNGPVVVVDYAKTESHSMLVCIPHDGDRDST